MTTKATFASIQELFEDMINNCRTFSYGVYKTTNTGKFAVTCDLLFDEFEFKDCNFETGNNELRFSQSSEHNYSSLNLELHNVIGGHRLGDPNDTEIFEYSFYLKDSNEPFPMLAYGWYKGDRS